MKHSKQTIEELIANMFGIDPQSIVSADYRVNEIVIDEDTVLETVFARVSAASSQMMGTKNYMYSTQMTCPTCNGLIQVPHKQIKGTTKCCNRIYCASPNCQNRYRRCEICNELTCDYCGVPYIIDRRLIMVHSGACQRKMERFLQHEHPTSGLVFPKPIGGNRNA